LFYEEGNHCGKWDKRQDFRCIIASDFSQLNVDGDEVRARPINRLFKALLEVVNETALRGWRIVASMKSDNVILVFTFVSHHPVMMVLAA
jgi:hypothetical protein